MHDIFNSALPLCSVCRPNIARAEWLGDVSSWRRSPALPGRLESQTWRTHWIELSGQFRWWPHHSGTRSESGHWQPGRRTMDSPSTDSNLKQQRSAFAFWNDPPLHVASAPSLAIFGQRLKTFMFSRSYQDSIIWLVCYYHHLSLLSWHPWSLQ